MRLVFADGTTADMPLQRIYCPDYGYFFKNHGCWGIPFNQVGEIHWIEDKETNG